MFARMAMGWRLGMSAFGVLWSDKKLLIFPLLSGIACLLVLATFVAPLVLSERLRDMLTQRDDDLNQPLWYAGLFLFYFVNYFVIIFFNSALVSCALARFNGLEPTLGDGIAAACSRLPQILGWSLVSATVGVVLKIIEDRSEKVGQFVTGLLGMAWGLMTYFVVPILVVEKAGPIDATKRSCALMKKAWGESLVANFGASLLILVFVLAALVPAIIGILIGGGTALIVGAITTFVLLLVVSLVSSAVNTIIVAAMYQYAAYEKSPDAFDVDLLHGAFARAGSR